MRSLLNDAYAILFSYFLYKNICCGYSFELPQFVNPNFDPTSSEAN